MFWCNLPVGVMALQEGDRIWMDRDLLQSERRSTLAHELEHRDRGHVGCQSRTVECAVEQAAARQLISLPMLAEAIVWSTDEEELADELWVDVDMVRARLAALTDDEKAYIDGVIAKREQGC